MVYHELVTRCEQIFECAIVAFEHADIDHAKFVQITFVNRAQRVIFYEMLSEQLSVLLHVDISEIMTSLYLMINVDMTVMRRIVL